MRQNWRMWSGAISDFQIAKIVSKAENIQKAETFNQGGSEVRSSRVAWLSDNKDILDMLFEYVEEANQNHFKTHVYKKADIQYTEYHASEGGHYNWHHDIDWVRNDGLDRKLSVTVQLSEPHEYEGGNFEFSEVESPNSQSRAKGTVLVFPSYLSHRVMPVTRGIRKSLVAWFEGPTWQ